LNKQSDHFSKDNWGDTTKERNGKQVKDRHATKYVDTICAFSDTQWAAIHNTASQWVKKKKAGSSRSSSMDVDVPGIASDEDDHFVLKADTPAASGTLVSSPAQLLYLTLRQLQALSLPLRSTYISRLGKCPSLTYTNTIPRIIE
jgi:hypothetical protein